MTDPIAVYVHIPFCTVKCGYCDFNAYAGLHHLADRYHEALLADLDSWAPDLRGRAVSSIGFGGGTPSEVPAAHIASVIDRVRALGTLESDAEITLEANPGTLTGSYLRDLFAAGVTRLSIGAQSFDATELRFLDRIHSPEATTAAVGLAREAGFTNLNLDLIYGLPGHTPGTFAPTLAAAIALRPDHISAYALTVEEGTPLAARVASGAVILPTDDDLAAIYDAASLTLEAAGYGQYELSNWARPGYESRHNTAYWLHRDYVGIGAGAHGFVAGSRFENIARPADYIAALLSPTADPTTHPGVSAAYTPAGPDAIADWLSVRLRLLAGFTPLEFRHDFGVPFEDVVGPVVERAAQAGVLAVNDRVHLTTAGRLLHGELIVDFLTHLHQAG
ncbi:MAG TPA: radical SAM family heme chaperone HemW [Tepidiformaceae bacterium]|nr:radical SAM family heme chaperone HemW [Tepidiformaceae bacterium]